MLLEKYKHLQRKVDQWLVFAEMRQKITSFRLNIINKKLTKIPAKNHLFLLQYDIDLRISSLRQAIIHENFIFTQKYAFVERCCFPTFSFEGKLRKYDISMKRKHTKTNEIMIFSALITNFRMTKILFFMHCYLKRRYLFPKTWYYFPGWETGEG